MTNSLVPTCASLAPASDTAPSIPRLLDAFLAGRSEHTLRAYRNDLDDFRAFARAFDLGEAARSLLAHGQGEGNVLALEYRADLLARGLAPATINRRLAALRSLVKLGRVLGIVAWGLDVPSVRGESYRDTKGPGRVGYVRMVRRLVQDEGVKTLRDRAIIHLLFDLALRRGEVVGLDLEDLNLAAGMLAVLGKGRGNKELLSLPDPTAKALAAWVGVRSTEPGPLFINFDRAGKGGRLTGHSVYRIVQALGRQVGLKVRPHGLRHAAITEALELTQGNVRAVQRFSRHRDVKVLMAYDDNRQDLGGEVARMVAGEL